MADTVRVEPTALTRAAAHAATAAHVGAPGHGNVQPCAPDVVSVGVSTQFAALMTLARHYTHVANALSHHYGALLDTSAAAYTDQETASASALGAGRGAHLPVPTIHTAALLTAPPLPSAPAGQTGGGAGGEAPSSPRDIARLIDQGRHGPGPHAWQAAASSLNAEADRLDLAAQQLRAALHTAAAAWQATSAEAARVRLQQLQTWYVGHAAYTRELAGVANSHVAAFHHAAATIPTLKAVADAERELNAANAANARSGGKLKPAVVHAQLQVGKLYQESTKGFAVYTASAPTIKQAPAPPPAPPVPGPVPPPPTPDPSDVTTQHQLRDSPPQGPPPPATPAGPAGTDPMPGLHPGQAWPADAADPPPLVSAPLGQAVAPLILGGLGGALGGALGGLSSAAQRMPHAMGAPSMPAAMGAPSAPPGGGDQGQDPGGGAEPASPPSGPADPKSDLAGPPDADTEPAGQSSPLTAPIEMAPAPTQAAPLAAAPMTAAATETAAGVNPAMGAMVPPMMGPHSSGSAPENKDLYKQRKLAIVAPPNSEPVKGRREKRDKDRNTDHQQAPR